MAAAGAHVGGVGDGRAVEVGRRAADVGARDDLSARRVEFHQQGVDGVVLVGPFDLFDHVVGSIGVIGSRVNVSELAEDLGVSYERFAAGKYKDAGMPLKDLSEDEREYLQGIIDGFYDDFVERVAEGRDMDPEAVRDTEARIYLGDEAHELGLVDSIGTRDDVEDHVEGLLDAEVSIREFEPERGLAARLRGGATAVAYAAGAGVASAVVGDERDFRLRF